MGKFEDLIDLLLADDDEDADIEVHIFADEPEESKGKHESKPEDDEVEALRKKAKEQNKELAETFGAEIAANVVDFAANSAMITNLLRGNIPIPQDMVDDYNALCEKLYPEHCKPHLKAAMYAGLRELIKEGKRSLE